MPLRPQPATFELTTIAGAIALLNYYAEVMVSHDGEDWPVELEDKQDGVEKPFGYFFTRNVARALATAKAALQKPDDRDDRHADAFRELESDIGDLARAVDLGLLAANSDKADLMLFALHQIGPMATALKAQYYELWG
jgi:hypothetical protein